MANLKTFDMNLLIAFDLLMKERNVSRAAEKMFISQSAMSHVLQRLRQQLEDPLLVKTPAGMTPTLRALSLVEPVATVLKEVESLIRAPAPFDPATCRRAFNIAATDYVEALLLPILAPRIARQAPGVDIHFKRTSSRFPFNALEQADIDLILGFDVMLNAPKHLNSERLFDDFMVCMARIGHPRVTAALVLEDYIDLPHILVSRTGASTGQVDAWLAEHGRERRVALTVSHFLSALLIVAQTDMVMAFPKRTAEQFARNLPLQLVPLPLDLPHYDTVMVWHPLQDQDLANRWLRDEIRAACAALDHHSPNFGSPSSGK
ncbi:LysR family transcriptional regulator [Methylomonas sp. MO1]|uniref:LysR family transcriptional regulator n=1 Tax=Methylomonas sp. MO1 TaxID=3073619 RepID=UPI0028A33CD4|nr:LysR family transcriptional regulator [Methylomonas sp. MO1]MDT4289970.1 LysR family transcriptional regulator [Methylomonas sp. MO1]